MGGLMSIGDPNKWFPIETLFADFIHEVDEGTQRLEQYIKAVDREINKRRQVIELLTLGSKYYESLLGEANIVANVSLYFMLFCLTFAV